MLSLLSQLFRRPNSIPPLPTELIIYIIDYARDDRDVLKACALVCSTWLPIAHAAFFEHISLTVSTNLQESVNAKLGCMKNHVGYVQWLLLSSPTASEMQLSLTVLIGIVSRFPNLKELELLHFWLYDDSPSILATLIQPHTSINTLRLTMVSFGVLRGEAIPNMFYPIFNLFPAIEHLICFATSAHKVMDTEPVQTVIPPLRTLSCSFMFDNFPGFVGLLLPFMPESLQTIGHTGILADFDNLLDLCKIERNRDSLRILRFCAESRDLEVLVKGSFITDADILLSKQERIEAYWDTLGLRSYTALHTINIVIKKRWFHSRLPILTTLPQSLHILTFELCWRTTEDPRACLDGLHSAYIERCIDRGLPNLREIRFMPHCVDQELEGPVQALVRTMMGELDVRGFVRILDYCERMEGCQYEKPSVPKRICTSS